jgi:SAM-dependent methyltransferase
MTSGQISVEQLRTEYDETRRPARWHVDESLQADDGLRARNRSAEMIAGLPVDESAILNGSLPPEQMEDLLSGAEQRLLTEPLRGVGLELGAGLGVLAATVAKRNEVRYVLAVEVCENFVACVIPNIARQVLGDRSNRVIPVLGSFDSLEIDDASIDFVVEIDSLHHSPSLLTTLTECARVLKQHGRLICFDRAHHDDLPNELREQMLNRVYDEEWIRKNGYPPHVSMTRRQNGEHEIRMGEWRKAFGMAGFEVERVVQFVADVDLKLALKGAISRLPGPIRRRLVKIPLVPGYPTAWILAKVHRDDLRRQVIPGPKSTTGFAVRKR